MQYHQNSKCWGCFGKFRKEQGTRILKIDLEMTETLEGKSGEFWNPHLLGYWKMARSSSVCALEPENITKSECRQFYWTPCIWEKCYTKHVMKHGMWHADLLGVSIIYIDRYNLLSVDASVFCPNLPKCIEQLLKTRIHSHRTFKCTVWRANYSLLDTWDTILMLLHPSLSIGASYLEYQY